MLGKLQKNKNVIKKERAITLITLVITIILLIILAGVAINVALGQNGLFKRAKEAKLTMQEATVKEIIEHIILQMQIDEIEKGENLTLKQVAENLEIKDSNITLEKYTEGEKELKGTYNLNGEEYKFTINEKLEVEVIGKAEEKIVSIQEITWQNGKPQVTLTSKEQGTIEYKDSDGTWKTFDNETQLENGTTLTVRVKLPTGETTKEEQIEIRDKIKPTEFEIEVASNEIQAKAVTVSLKSQPQDNETGVKEGYTYVVETNGSKIEKTNITDTTYKITGLEPETSYTVYVIAYDNAGNYRESNKIKITTLEYIPPTSSAPNNGTTIRQGNKLPFTWTQLSEISTTIENTLKDDDPNNDITNNTNEFILNYEGKNYTIGVGDWTTVNNNYVRIIGFNHDKLVGTIEEQNNDKYTTAGISFEFVQPITSDLIFNDKYISGTCWENSSIRTKLNNDICKNLENFKYIKEVKKSYTTNPDSASVLYCQDKLWLLSDSEIFNNDLITGNYATVLDGENYKLYKNYNLTPKWTGRNNDILLKRPYDCISKEGGIKEYWLRNVGKFGSTKGVRYIGYYLYDREMGGMATNSMNQAKGVYPGFCL